MSPRKASHEPTPLGDRLRAMSVPYAATGNIERAQGHLQAADLVDEEAHLLSGKAFVDALDRMIATRLESFASEFVADVVAALRDSTPPPAAKVRAAREGRAAREQPRAAPAAAAPAPPLRLAPASVAGHLRRAEGSLSGGERKVLTAIAQHGREGVTLAQLQVLTGYAARTRQNLVQSLSGRGLVMRGGRGLVATDRGIKELGPSFKRLPTGKALLDHWLSELGEGERTVLGLVVRYYPHPVGVERIDEQTGYAPRTRQNLVQSLTSRHLLTKTGRGFVQACDHLFDDKAAAGAGA